MTARNSFSQLAGSDLTQLSRVSQLNTSRILTMLDDHLSDAATPGADPRAPEFRANEADLYAQSRGMPAEEAERRIVRGFLEQVVAQVPSERIKAAVLGALSARIGSELDNEGAAA